MTPKQFFVILLACLAVFLPTVVLRFWPYGFDSYYYLNVVCNGAALTKSEPLLSQAFFSLVPCNVPFLLGINFFLMLGCCIWASLLGEYFVPKKGWLAGFFVLASFLFTMSFFSIESEPFAYFLCLAAAWLFYSGKKFKKLFAIALVLVATQFWLGSFLMFVAFSLSSLFLLPFSLIGIVWRWREVSGQLLPNFAVMESWPGYGLFYQGLLMVSFLYLKYLKPIFVPTTFFILIAFVNMKFAFFAAFFLAILAAKQATLKEIGWLRFLPFIGVLFCTCYLWGVAATLPPSVYDVGAVQLAVQEAHGSVVCNQWGYGHLISFFGGVPSDKAGGQQLCTSCKDCVMLTFEEQPACRLLMGEAENALQVKVYRCFLPFFTAKHNKDALPSYFLRGLSQYGLLHFGQTLGVSCELRGTQTCLHRSHL